MNEEALLGESAGQTIDTLFQALGFALVCVLLVGVGAVLVIRRLTQGTWRRPSRAQRILKIVDSVPLGGRRSLTVAKVHDHLLVLGVGPDTVQLLVEITEENAGDAETPRFLRELRRETLLAAQEVEA